jgi:uncharacterized membrane protein HdeD (DUF308 family)
MPTDLPVRQPDVEDIEQAVVKAMHKHWKLYLAEGVGLLILGLIAVIVPPLLVSGIIGLITTFWMRGAPGFWWSLASAFLAILAGIWLLAQPIAGPLTLTAVLIVFFLIEGVASIMFAIDHRRELSGRWGFMLVSGIVDLVLGVMLLAGWPSTAVWALGLLVGINLVFGGAALIAMALNARTAA